MNSSSLFREWHCCIVTCHSRNDQTEPCFAQYCQEHYFSLLLLALMMNLPCFGSTYKIPLKSFLSDLQYIGSNSRIREGVSLCVNIEHIFLLMWQRVRGNVNRMFYWVLGSSDHTHGAESHFLLPLLVLGVHSVQHLGDHGQTLTLFPC